MWSNAEGLSVALKKNKCYEEVKPGNVVESYRGGVIHFNCCNRDYLFWFSANLPPFSLGPTVSPQFSTYPSDGHWGPSAQGLLYPSFLSHSQHSEKAYQIEQRLSTNPKDNTEVAISVSPLLRTLVQSVWSGQGRSTNTASRAGMRPGSFPLWNAWAPETLLRARQSEGWATCSPWFGST